MTAARIRLVTIADRPDLAPIVAQWLWEAFDRADGYTLDQTRAMVAASTASRGVPQTFVLLVRGEPMATASFLAHDAPERPDLTPWLAGVFVTPEARSQGFARQLVGRVESAARNAQARTLWLYTHSAEHLYARLGWSLVERFDRGGRDATLMRRDVAADEAASGGA